MTENNQIDNSLRIDNWRYHGKKAMLRTFFVFATGVVVFLLFGLSVLVFYILFVISLVWGSIKYWEYTLPPSLKKLDERINKNDRTIQ